MAKTAGERQAAYRARRNERNQRDGEVILNTWLKSQAGFALKRLAQHHKLTQRALLEKLLIEADEAIIRTLVLDTSEWENYFSLHGNETI